MTEKPGIYQIKNLANGKVYVGSTSNISKRWSRHRIDLSRNQHSNTHLQASWNKYGSDQFQFLVLELTDDLNVREQYWMDLLHAYTLGYNKCPVARSSRGRVASPEAIESHRKATLKLWAERPEVFVGRRIRKGEELHNARLTVHLVQEIRKRYGPKTGPSKPHGQITYATLAREYGVGMVTIANVIKGKTWKEVPSGV